MRLSEKPVGSVCTALTMAAAALVASSTTRCSYAAVLAAPSETMLAVLGKLPSGTWEAEVARERERMLPRPPLPEDLVCGPSVKRTTAERKKRAHMGGVVVDLAAAAGGKVLLGVGADAGRGVDVACAAAACRFLRGGQGGRRERGGGTHKSLAASGDGTSAVLEFFHVGGRWGRERERRVS